MTRRLVLDAAPILLQRKLRSLAGQSLSVKAADDLPPGVQSAVPVVIPSGATPLIADPPPDYYDVLDDGTTDYAGYTIPYDSYLDDSRQIIVTKDLFGPGDFPHTYGGWPIPGEPYP